MSSVHVEALVEGERDRVVVECRVGRRVVFLDRRMCQPCDELLDPADALGPCDRVSKRRAIPSRGQTRRNLDKALTRTGGQGYRTEFC